MIKFFKIRFCILLIVLISFNHKLFAQYVYGEAKLLIGKTVFLNCYNGFQKANISSAVVDQNGEFKLTFDSKNYGLAFLSTGLDDELLLILNSNNIKVSTDKEGFNSSDDILEGKESKLLNEFKTIYFKSDQLISAWMYLNNIYKNDIYWQDTLKSKLIESEILNIQSLANNIVNELGENSYLKTYVSLFKLINTTPYLISYSKNNISSELNKFRNIDLWDDKIWSSGLCESFIQSYFYLIENSNDDFENVSLEMKKSIDIIISQLLKDDEKFKETTNFLINFFNKKGFREENDYLMDAMLKQSSCNLSEDLKYDLNRYKQLYIGEKAPDVDFSKFKNVIYNNSKPKNTLKNIDSDYKLLIFGSSKCHKCMEDIPLVENLYIDFRKNNFLEVIFISLDENQDDFKNFTQNFSFPSLCTLEKWETPVAKEYLVQFTPSMFLIDKDLNIVLKPNSVEHLKSWLTKYSK
jgi:hypothetical protein